MSLGEPHRQVLQPLRVGLEVTTRFLFVGTPSLTAIGLFALTLVMLNMALHPHCTPPARKEKWHAVLKVDWRAIPPAEAEARFAAWHLL